MRTLLIEADADHRHRLREVLRRFETPTNAADGMDAALSAAPAGQYELVLVGVDRIQPTREQIAALRQRVLVRQGLVSVVTANDDAVRLRRLIAEGFDDCLPDPALFGEEVLAVRLEVLRGRIRAMGTCWATIETQARPIAQCCPVADNLPYGIFHTSADGRFLEVNHKLVEMLGYDSAEEVLALDLARDVYQNPKFRKRMLQQTADRFEGIELPWKTKTGEPITVRLSGRSVRDAEGRLRDIYGLVEDVTDRRRAQWELQASEAKYRSLAEKTNDIPYSLDASGTVTYIGPQVARLGFDPDRVIGADFLDFVQPEDRQLVAEQFRHTISTGAEFPTQFRVCDGQGRIHWMEEHGKVQRDPHSGQFTGITGVLHDVTDRKLAEDAIREDQRRLRRLLDMHEHECRWTASEIHESFAQPLIGALMQLQAVQPALERSGTADQQRQYTSALEILQSTVNMARQMMGGLRPPILDEFGLIAAIENLVSEQWTDLKIEYTYDLSSQRLGEPLETAIFRIVQEAVANMLRHSRSDRGRIDLSQRDGHIQLDIQDWGQGFDPRAVPPHCFGLESIRERARLFGGTAEVRSTPEHGTRILVRFPASVAPP